MIAGVSKCIQSWSFANSGTFLVERIRKKYFKAVVNKEIAYFDKPENTPGNISSRLSTDCMKIAGASGVQVGAMVQSCSSFLVALVVAFYLSWKLALVTVALIPLVFIAFMLDIKAQTTISDTRKQSDKDQKSMEVDRDIGSLNYNDQYTLWASEILVNIRTVQSLTLEKRFFGYFSDALKKHTLQYRWKIAVRSIFYAFSQAMNFWFATILLRYGLDLIMQKV